MATRRTMLLQTLAASLTAAAVLPAIGGGAPLAPELVGLDGWLNRETGLAPATMRKYAFAERFLRHGRPGPERSILDPYLNHLHSRLDEGCENAMQLRCELRARGFPGTEKQVRRWLSERLTRPAKTTVARHRAPPAVAISATASSSPLPSSKQLPWRLLREPEDLDAGASV